MRRKKRLDPKTQWIITDPTNQPVAPAFYYVELARAAHRELSKEKDGLELREDAVTADGTFVDAMNILSRENRWLDASTRDKRFFQGLCEGWLTVPGGECPRAIPCCTGVI